MRRPRCWVSCSELLLLQCSLVGGCRANSQSCELKAFPATVACFQDVNKDDAGEDLADALQDA